MDTMTKKVYENYDYISRYSSVPNYFDSIKNRWVSGIGTNLYRNTAWVAHEVKYNDTLDSLALKYYNNPSYWWIIAYFNNIQDPFISLQSKFKAIKIPDMLSVEFGNERQ